MYVFKRAMDHTRLFLGDRGFQVNEDKGIVDVSLEHELARCHLLGIIGLAV